MWVQPFYSSGLGAKYAIGETIAWPGGRQYSAAHGRGKLKEEIGAKTASSSKASGTAIGSSGAKVPCWNAHA